MKLYVISTKYQPLVDVDRQASSKGKKQITKKNVTNHDLQGTFIASITDSLIACKSKNEAEVIAALLLKSPNFEFAEEHVEEGIKLFAVPVVYTVELNEETLPQEIELRADDLVNYADANTIPLYISLKGPNADELEKKRINDKINRLAQPTIMLRKLNRLKLENVVEATYLRTDAFDVVVVTDINKVAPGINKVDTDTYKVITDINEVDTDIIEAAIDVDKGAGDTSCCSTLSMQILSGFIAALGVAAVALSFALLNAATLGAAALAIGATATVLGSIGLFKYSSPTESNPPSETPSLANGPI